MDARFFFVLALGAALLVLAVDQAVKRGVGTLGGRRARVSRGLGLRRTLHVQGVHQRRLWGSEGGAAAVLLSIGLGLVVLHLWLGEAALAPLLALGVALGGATSNAIDLRRHGGIVNCITWNGRLAFNLADVAIVGGVLVALALGARLFEGAVVW